ncbi:WD40 repeat domain-containing protein [Candidatus Poribacteria bacterium]|nr:WD40 repeat domain-containing protein [Candidatus Poribacteria bacterium]
MKKFIYTIIFFSTIFLYALLGNITKADEHSQEQQEKLSPIWSVQFSPDGRTLAVGKYQWVELWDIETQTMIHAYEPHAGRVRCIKFSDDGKTLFAGGGSAAQSGEIRLWDVPTEELIKTIEIHADTIESIAISPNNGKLLTASMDEFSAVIDLSQYDENQPIKDQAKWLTQHVGRVLATLYHPSGTYFVTGSEDKTLKVWDPQDYTVLVSFDGNDDSVYSLAYAARENLIVSASADSTVRSWRITQNNNGETQGAPVRQFNQHDGAVYSVDCGIWNGTEIIASGSADTSVIIWNIRNGNRPRTFNDATDEVYTVDISPNGQQVAAGSRDGKVRIWNIGNNSLSYEF